MTTGAGGPVRVATGAGSDGRMSDLEALMWRLGDHDSRLRSTMSLVAWFDGDIDRAALIERIDGLTRRVPLLRHRVAAGRLGMVAPRWDPDPAFALRRHLQVARVSGPVGVEAVAADIVSSPFPADRPPWRAVLVPGPPDALVLHLHHSYTDGLGGVRLLAELFDLSPSGRPADPDSQVGERGVGEREGGGGSREATGLGHDLRRELVHSLRLVGRAVPWAVRGVGVASQGPDSALQAASELLVSARTHVRAATGPPSPVFGPRSSEVHLAVVEAPLESLRRVGGRLGVKINDVFVGVLLEGLARYHEKCGVLPASLRLGVPISTRPTGTADAGMHNQLYGALLRGPLGPLDFEERTRLVHEMLRHGRHQPWAGWVEDAAGLASRVPGAIGLVASALASLDAVASNVTGPPFGLYLGGTLVERMVPVGPRSGSAVNATLLSYRGVARIGINIDPRAVADPEVLVDCVRAAVDEHVVAGPV